MRVCVSSQVTKLNTDAASVSARPSTIAPAKLAAPGPTTYEPRLDHWQPWNDPAPEDVIAAAAARSAVKSPTPSKQQTLAEFGASPTRAREVAGTSGAGVSGPVPSTTHPNNTTHTLGDMTLQGDQPDQRGAVAKKRLFSGIVGTDGEITAAAHGEGGGDQAGGLTSMAQKRARVIEDVSMGHVSAGDATGAAVRATAAVRVRAAAPRASEIDPSVLAELPEDVRRELRSVYGKIARRGLCIHSIASVHVWACSQRLWGSLHICVRTLALRSSGSARGAELRM